MSDAPERPAPNKEPGEQQATTSRRPWSTPRVIVSDAKNTENLTIVNDDGPSSVSS